MALNSSPANPPREESKVIRRELTAARDDQILRVLAYVDGLAERGDADALIAPIRARLALIRPARPLNFTRLLFEPFDPLIVPGACFQRDMPNIPRPALLPLGRLVRSRFPQCAETVESMICGHTDAQRCVVSTAGEKLWPAAAAAFADAVPPPDWQEASGLSMADFIPLARALAGLMAAAPEIARAAHNYVAGAEIAETTLIRLLTAAAETTPCALAMMVALLLARLAGDGRILDLAGRVTATAANPAIKASPGVAVAFAIDDLENSVDSLIARPGPLGQDADIILCMNSRFAALLKGEHRADRRQRIDAARQRLGNACRTRFEAELLRNLLDPLSRLSSEPDDATVIGFETTARALRRFEHSSRSAGGGEIYDRLLRAASRTVADRQALPNTQPLVDRARLVEILSGPEAGLAYLREADEAPGDAATAETAQTVSGPSRSPTSSVAGNAQAR